MGGGRQHNQPTDTDSNPSSLKYRDGRGHHHVQEPRNPAPTTPNRPTYRSGRNPGHSQERAPLHDLILAPTPSRILETSHLSRKLEFSRCDKPFKDAEIVVKVWNPE